MIVTNIVPRDIIISLDLTLSEVDAISLALSKCSVNAENTEESSAAQVLTSFAKMLDELLERMSDHEAADEGK